VKILERRLAQQILPWLNRGKVIVITGARQVGKTTLLQELFSSRDNLIWLNADEANVRLRLENPSLNILQGIIGNYKLLIIDEVQRIQNAGLLLKLIVDNFKDVQVIATGSSALDISETIFEPLTGRHLLFHLYPFALAELYPTKSSFEVEQEFTFHLVFGSYPDVFKKRAGAAILLKNLANQYLYKDILTWKNIRKPELLDKLLKLLAFQMGSEVSYHELATQLNVKAETVESYITLLEKAFVVFRLRAYSTNARKELSKSNKVYFWDNGIRNAILDAFQPLELRNDIGALWENFMISERMKMNAYVSNATQSFFWRNYNQSEVDYLELTEGNLSAFEFKWGIKKKSNVNKAFIHAYPEAETEVVTPLNFMRFCRII
jgi:predicted AAA+ superfamily ATPase